MFIGNKEIVVSINRIFINLIARKARDRLHASHKGLQSVDSNNKESGMSQIFKDMFELRVTMLALSDLVKRVGMKHSCKTKDLLELINLQAPLIT